MRLLPACTPPWALVAWDATSCHLPLRLTPVSVKRYLPLMSCPLCTLQRVGSGGESAITVIDLRVAQLHGLELQVARTQIQHFGEILRD
jgi:hypothetical protein